MANANRHPVTNEHIPPYGFPALPDGREVRDRLSTAALLGFTNPDSVFGWAKRHGLTIFKGPNSAPGNQGAAANYYLLDEILAAKAAASQIRPAIEVDETEAE